MVRDFRGSCTTFPHVICSMITLIHSYISELEQLCVCVCINIYLYTCCSLGSVPEKKQKLSEVLSLFQLKLN